MGLSQESLAKKIGVSFRAIYRWEHGETIPRSDSLERLAKVFGVPLEWFFSDEPSDSIPPDVLEAVKHPRMQEVVRLLRPFILDEDS